MQAFASALVLIARCTQAWGAPRTHTGFSPLVDTNDAMMMKISRRRSISQQASARVPPVSHEDYFFDAHDIASFVLLAMEIFRTPNAISLYFTRQQYLFRYMLSILNTRHLEFLFINILRAPTFQYDIFAIVIAKIDIIYGRRRQDALGFI